MDKVHQPLCGELRVHALRELGVVRGYAPRTAPPVALLAQRTSHGHQRRGGDIYGVSTQCNRFYNIAAVPETSGSYQRHFIPYAFLPQPLVHSCYCNLGRYTNVVPDGLGCCAGPAAEAVNRNNVRARPRNAARYCCDVMDGRYLDRYGLLVPGGFLQCINELFQVLDGIDVVVRCRRNRVRTNRDHPGFRNTLEDLFARQMSSDARLCALADLDLYGCACIQVFRAYAEPARGALYYRVFSVPVKSLRQTAFPGVPEYAQFLRGTGDGFAHIVIYRSVRHGRKHDRRLKDKLWCELRGDIPVLVHLEFVRFPSEECLQLHGFPERIYGRIGHLARVDNHVFPVIGKRLVVAHAGDDDPACPSLLIKVLDVVVLPVCVEPEGVRIPDDADTVGRTESRTPHTSDAIMIQAVNKVAVRIIIIRTVRALGNAGFTSDTLIYVPLDYIIKVVVVGVLVKHAHQPPSVCCLYFSCVYSLLSLRSLTFHGL